MRVARMKWGDEATVIKIDVRKFFYSIDRSVLKQIIAKRFKTVSYTHLDVYKRQEALTQPGDVFYER